jgi:hypothetical protein
MGAPITPQVLPTSWMSSHESVLAQGQVAHNRNAEWSRMVWLDQRGSETVSGDHHGCILVGVIPPARPPARSASLPAFQQQ